MSDEVYLPEIAGLDWIEDFLGPSRPTDIQMAMPTESYWQLHRIGKAKLRDVGFRVERDSVGGWTVVYQPGADPEVVRSTIATVTAEAAAAEAHRLALEADAKAAREAAMTVDDKERERRRLEYAEQVRTEIAAKAERHKAAVAAAQDEAKKVLFVFGDFTHKRALLADLAGRERLDRKGLKALLCLIDGTRSKHITRLARAEAEAEEGGGVDWSDESVERGVIYLTDSDPDHAGVINDAGWSKADSSTGHWCRAMLAPAEEDDWAMVSIAADRKRVAISTARRVIGKYERQLKIAGVL